MSRGAGCRAHLGAGGRRSAAGARAQGPPRFGAPARAYSWLWQKAFHPGSGQHACMRPGGPAQAAPARALGGRQCRPTADGTPAARPAMRPRCGRSAALSLHAPTHRRVRAMRWAPVHEPALSARLGRMRQAWRPDTTARMARARRSRSASTGWEPSRRRLRSSRASSSAARRWRRRSQRRAARAATAAGPTLGPARRRRDRPAARLGVLEAHAGARQRAHGRGALAGIAHA